MLMETDFFWKLVHQAHADGSFELSFKGGAAYVSLADARVQAANLRAIARAGGNPIAERDKTSARALLSKKRLGECMRNSVKSLVPAMRTQSVGWVA